MKVASLVDWWDVKWVVSLADVKDEMLVVEKVY